MTVAQGPRWAWTSNDDGSGIGTIFVLGNVPLDIKIIGDPPEPSIGCDNNMRYWYDEPVDEWKLRDSAWPANWMPDHWAYDWSPRYEIDTTDPLRNSWVLKPDALPVEQPNAP